MTITAVQSATATGTTSVTATLPSTPTQYNTLIVAVMSATSHVNLSLTGFTKHLFREQQGWSLTVWSRPVGAGESAGVTVSGGGNPTNIVVREYSGLTLAPFDVSVSAVNVSTASLASGSTASTAQDEELAFVALGVQGNFSAPSFSDGFTARHTLARLAVGDKTLSAIGTVSTTASWTSARGAILAVATFKGGTQLLPGRKAVGVPAALRSGPGNPEGDPAPTTRVSWASTSAVAIDNADSHYPWNPIVSYNTQTGTFDDYQVREPGNSIYDPITGLWMLPYTTLDGAVGTTTISAHLSNNGDQWYPHPDNPIGGSGLSSSTRGEDPYLAKNLDGTLHRDSSGRALMYCEEKPSSVFSQQGIVLFRSAPWTLDTWVQYGRVLDKSGTTNAWDRDDRTSPVVLWDGTQYVMLFEGRNLVDTPINEGEVGVAYSSDGLSFTVGNGAAPIISRSSVGAWAAGGIVPDDVAKFGNTWVMTCHGQGVTGNRTSPQPFNNVGRWATTDDPGDWDSSSFTEMAGNPFDTSTSTVMFSGDRDGRAIAELDRQRLYAVDLVTP